MAVKEAKTLEVLIDRVLPAYIRDDNPMFALFMRKYFEWLSREKGEYDLVAHLFLHGDIDRTLDEFVQYFKLSYTQGFPDSIAADARFLIKQIKSLYLSKGTEKSYSFLFKALFDSFTEFYYPKNDILRASDGKWIEPVYLKIDISGLPFPDVVKYIDQEIVGSVSAATSFVEGFVQFEDLPDNPGLFLPHFRLSTIGSGNFQAGENITIVNNVDNVDSIPVLLVSTGDGRYEGKFSNRDGFLSDKNKLQDNFYYQDFSYVIKSEVSNNFYEEIIKDLIHPAGFKMFGEVRLTDEEPKELNIHSVEVLYMLLIYYLYSLELGFDNNELVVISPTDDTTLSLFGGEYTYAWVESMREHRIGEAMLHAGVRTMDHIIINDFESIPNEPFLAIMADEEII
jgi:hypothetical protein